MTQPETRVTTGLVRVSYEHLFHPVKRSDDIDAAPKYSAVLLIPKTDIRTIAAIRTAIEKATLKGVQEKWNGKRPAMVSNTFHDGDMPRPSDGEAYGDECKGMMVLNVSATEKYPPRIIDNHKQQILDETQIYSGVWGMANVDFYAYSHKSGKKGISCGINIFMKIKDDTPLGGAAVNVDEAFGNGYEIDPITGELTAIGADNAVPF